MRKLMWLLPAAALWIAPPAPAQGPFGRPSGPRFGPHFPGVPDVGDPFGRQSGTPGLPGQFDPFGRPRSPWPNLDPANPLGRPGLPGQRFGPPWDVPGRPGGTARFFDPQRRSLPFGPAPSDPANPLNRWGPQGRDIGPATSQPGPPRLQTPPPVDLGSLIPPIKPPQFDIKPPSMSKGTLPGLERSETSAGSHSFDPSWWPWVFGGAAIIFVVSLIAGYASGRCHA